MDAWSSDGLSGSPPRMTGAALAGMQLAVVAENPSDNLSARFWDPQFARGSPAPDLPQDCHGSAQLAGCEVQPVLLHSVNSSVGRGTYGKHRDREKRPSYIACPFFGRHQTMTLLMKLMQVGLQRGGEL